ncbi:MAG: VCBS repeat-containing protein [Candidatus Hydrogenedentes bacterium]|nr:VCBS repeat-containing protein [Candidatus Hydrogenedentota bacterium]
MNTTPSAVAKFDLGRSQPSVQAIALPDGKGYVGLALVSGALNRYEQGGALKWTCHPAGLNFTAITSTEDFDGDGHIEVLLAAGRPCAPFGAAALVSLEDGRLLWRYDVEPMSYAWYLYADHYLPGSKAKQIVVVMHAYPPDPKNGYIALFAFPKAGATPTQKWRYDFDKYTCFPSLLQTDLDGDGVNEIVVETHSRMWLLDAVTGGVKQFYEWDVSPANIRSYGFVKFVDLNGDGSEDFLCIANFAQHHEVLLNKNGKLEKAWGYGWPESVTVGKVATTWADPPYADVDGDGKLEIVLSMFNSEGENAWLVRVYDAATGVLKYRMPGVDAVSRADVDGDGIAEIIGNETSDPTRTSLKGARAYKVKDAKLEEIWRDDTAKSVAVKTKRQEKTAASTETAVVEKEGAQYGLEANKEKSFVLTALETSAPTVTYDFSRAPAVVGPGYPSLFAADLDGDGRNELVLFQDSKVKVLKLDGAALKPAGEYPSTSEPVLADLNGDGKLEIVLSTVTPDAQPIVEAKTPSLENKTLWRTQYPSPGRTGLPQPRKAYLRTAHFTGKPTPDLYVWAGTPVVRSSALDGLTGALLWDKGESPKLERWWGASMNYAATTDFDGDDKEDLVFTNPDYYCVTSGPTGDFLLGPLFPPEIFKQPSQGLYTFPAILDQKQGEPTVCLVDGHYFQGAMSLHAKPYWYKLPAPGENRAACEGFMKLPDGTWLMGFGRQNGNFACINVADGTVRWELPVEATCTDTITCDVDGDGKPEFVFGTSHGALYAVGDDANKARVLWKVNLGAAAGAPIAADLDGDGASEIVVPTSDGFVQVLSAKSGAAG